MAWMRRRQPVDREALQRAMAKLQAGGKLNQADQRLINRFQAERDEEQRWSFYRAIPIGHWQEMSGRQATQLREQAQRYGISFWPGPVDLTRVVRELHEFLGTHGKRLRMGQGAGDDPLLVGENSPALERYRLARAKLAEHDLEEREHSTLRRADMRRALGLFAATLRRAGEILQRTYGPEAQQIWDEALDDAVRAVEAGFKQDESS